MISFSHNGPMAYGSSRVFLIGNRIQQT